MTNILLLEDVPEASQWLKVQASPRSSRSRSSSRPRASMRRSPMIAKEQIDVALIDLGLPDGSGVDVVAALREAQPKAQAVVVTIHDDDDHLFPALQAGAFGYVLKDQFRGRDRRPVPAHEPGRAASLAGDRAARHGALRISLVARERRNVPHVVLTDRENEVLLRVAKGFTLPEIAVQLNLSRHTISDYVKQIYRKLNVSSRAEAALEAQRLGLFGRGRRAQAPPRPDPPRRPRGPPGRHPPRRRDRPGRARARQKPV